jgi:hypothetical protein
LLTLIDIDAMEDGEFLTPFVKGVVAFVENRGGTSWLQARKRSSRCGSSRCQEQGKERTRLHCGGLADLAQLQRDTPTNNGLALCIYIEKHSQGSDSSCPYLRNVDMMCAKRDIMVIPKLPV